MVVGRALPIRVGDAVHARMGAGARTDVLRGHAIAGIGRMGAKNLQLRRQQSTWVEGEGRAAHVLLLPGPVIRGSGQLRRTGRRTGRRVVEGIRDRAGVVAQPAIHIAVAKRKSPAGVVR